jgi:sugar transferase (PEP-CTERM/EpsH1 system associated)
MARILFLSHRIPYPPNKGDKIRSWHFLRHLATNHDVSLASFVDDPDDMRYAETLREICVECYLEPIARSPLQWRNLSALTHGQPITLTHYRSRRMRQQVAALAGHQPDLVFAFSGAMTQYMVNGNSLPQRCIVDFADVDSDKWAQYARQRSPLAGALYRREARTLLRYERRAARHAEASLFVSEVEADLFRGMAPESASKVHAIRNGVDAEFFAPDPTFHSPFDAAARPLVFTGMMDYWANVDGAKWFAEHVFPVIRQREPRAELWLVGASPTAAVQGLGQRPGVRVTGRVPDVRPYLQHAALVVAPLRIARGVQNKILEAMAMSRAVVTTPTAADGVDGATVDHELIAARSETSYADSVCALLAQPDLAEEMGKRARTRVLKDYAWTANLARLDALVTQPARTGTTRRPTAMVE